MNNVKSIFKHVKSKRYAFVTDDGVFVMHLTGTRTIERMKQLIEDGVKFIRSTVVLDEHWEAHPKPVVAGAKPNAVNMLVKFSACRRTDRYTFFKVANSDDCYWLFAHEPRDMFKLRGYVGNFLRKSSWKDMRAMYGKHWEFVSLAKKLK